MSLKEPIQSFSSERRVKERKKERKKETKKEKKKERKEKQNWRLQFLFMKDRGSQKN